MCVSSEAKGVVDAISRPSLVRSSADTAEGSKTITAGSQIRFVCEARKARAIPCYMVWTTTTIAFHWRQSRRIECTSRRRCARDETPSPSRAAGTTTRHVSKTPTILSCL